MKVMRRGRSAHSVDSLLRARATAADYHMIRAVRWLWVACAAAHNFTLKDVVFHVGHAVPAACTVSRDLHVLTGSFDYMKGGSLSVHVLNGSLPNYTLTLSSRLQITNAKLMCHGVPLMTEGFITCNTSSLTCNNVILTSTSGGVPHSVLDLRSGPNPPPPPPSHIVFKDTMFHVSMASPWSDVVCTRKRDIHLITGTVTNAGGTLKVHVLNDSLHDYSIAVGVARGSYRSFGDRDINATLTCDGRRLPTTGYSSCNTTTCTDVVLTYSGSGKKLLAFDLDLGPNLPLPPPPPPLCSSAFDKTDCHGIPGCQWCTSQDRVHALCFTAQHEPATNWTCA